MSAVYQPRDPTDPPVNPKHCLAVTTKREGGHQCGLRPIYPARAPVWCQMHEPTVASERERLAQAAMGRQAAKRAQQRQYATWAPDALACLRLLLAWFKLPPDERQEDELELCLRVYALVKRLEGHS